MGIERVRSEIEHMPVQVGRLRREILQARSRPEQLGRREGTSAPRNGDGPA
jgi:hypothetical protein